MNLDSRQRAMLQEMGVTIWWPMPPADAAALTLQQQACVEAVQEDVPPEVQSESVSSAQPIVSVPEVPRSVSSVAQVMQPVKEAKTAELASQQTALAWQIAEPVQAFEHATAGTAQDGWLVILESSHPHAPLEGDSGKLLQNMLRALRLHHNAHVWIAPVQRPGYEALPVPAVPEKPLEWLQVEEGLKMHVQRIRPARILVLGLHAARVVLEKDEALGLLRAQVHTLHGVPAVVSYDPAYLLRAAHAKPAAWGDLCRAYALRADFDRGKANFLSE